MCFSGVTDGSHPGDPFQLGVDVLRLDILDIVMPGYCKLSTISICIAH